MVCCDAVVATDRLEEAAVPFVMSQELISHSWLLQLTLCEKRLTSSKCCRIFRVDFFCSGELIDWPAGRVVILVVEKHWQSGFLHNLGTLRATLAEDVLCQENPGQSPRLCEQNT